MQVPLPRRADGSLSTTNVLRTGPLPANHPLKREMDELKATRKKRQFYWAGLIEDLGDDEWGNPANYDRQRWGEEEGLADKKFEELAGQIKLAEMGFPLLASEDQDQSRRTPAEWESNQGPTADAYPDRYNRDRGGTVRMQQRGRQNRSHLYRQSSSEGLRSNSKAMKPPNPNAPPRKEIFWTQQKRASAVDKWMDQMGMNSSRKPSFMEPQDIVGGVPSSSDHVATDDEDPERVGSFNGLRAVDSHNDHHVLVEHHEITVGPLWTILDEVAFEEAEREREEERLLLGQYQEEDREERHTIETNTTSALTPSRTATLVKQSEKELPRKQTSPSVPDPDLMSALTSRLPKEQVIAPNPIRQQAPASSRENDANNESLDLTSRPVPDLYFSRTSVHRESLPQPSCTDPSPEVASNTKVKVNTGMASSAEPEPLGLSKTDATRQDHVRLKVAADLIEPKEPEIERLDMRNDISSDGSETELHHEPYLDGNDKDGFTRIDDTPRLSSPISIANTTPRKPATSSGQNKPPPNFSSLGLHYRNALKVNEMFSPAGSLLSPEPGSAAARLRILRGSYGEYSDIIRRLAAAQRNTHENDGRIVVGGVSTWVDARIWLVDWRERLDM